MRSKSSLSLSLTHLDTVLLELSHREACCLLSPAPAPAPLLSWVLSTCLRESDLLTLPLPGVADTLRDMAGLLTPSFQFEIVLAGDVPY